MVADAGATTTGPRCTGTGTGASGLSPGPGGIKVAGDTVVKDLFSCSASFSSFKVTLNKSLRTSFGVHAHDNTSGADFTCHPTSDKAFSCRGHKEAAHRTVVATVETKGGCTHPTLTAKVTVGGRTSSLVAKCMVVK